MTCLLEPRYEKSVHVIAFLVEPKKAPCRLFQSNMEPPVAYIVMPGHRHVLGIRLVRPGQPVSRAFFSVVRKRIFSTQRKPQGRSPGTEFFYCLLNIYIFLLIVLSLCMSQILISHHDKKMCIMVTYSVVILDFADY